MSCSNSSSLSLSSFSLSSYSSDGRDDDSCKKLSFHSLPARFPPTDPLGAWPPPTEASPSVPFRWEEAPGRPRVPNDVERDKNDIRCLELPPRLLSERHVGTRHHGRITNMPSPTTVLDGPDNVGRSLTYGVTFRSFRSPEKQDRVGHFGSSRWGGSFRKSAEDEDSNDFSSPVFAGAATSGGGGDPGGNACKVKMTKIKNVTKSRVWESIYGSLKQVVPWKRRERVRK